MQVLPKTFDTIDTIILYDRLPVEEDTFSKAVQSANAKGFEVRHYLWVALFTNPSIALEVPKIRDQPKTILPAIYLGKHEERPPACSAVILQAPDDNKYRMFEFAVFHA